MAKKFLTPINVVNLSSDPASGTEGDVYYNTVSDKLKIYSNSTWSEVSQGSIVYYQTTAPSSPSIGDVWVDSDEVYTTINPNDYMPKTGGTFTGTVVVPSSTTSLSPLRIPHGTAPSSPTNGDFWTTTSGIFARINGVTIGPIGSGGATISDTAPSSPVSGQLWYNSSDGRTYIYYQDGSSSQWVEIGTASISPTANYDGGQPDTNYGGVPGLDGGGVT